MQARRLRTLSAFTLLIGGALVAPLTQARDAFEALREQGHYWYANGNNERSQAAWNRLLELDPKDAQALYWQGQIALREGNLVQAQAYLKRLEQRDGQGEQAKLLAQDIFLAQPGRGEQLEQARVLAESGELDAAIAAYRQLLGGRHLHGDLAFEYYGYLAYTDESEEDARRGLEYLARQYPERGDIALALAKLLTRDLNLRSEGLRQLAVLADHPQVGAEALEYWREVLTWMGPPHPVAVSAFEDYLKRVPDDEAIRAQLNAALRSTSPTGDDPLAGAFKALERGDVAAADKLFSTRLKSQPNDADTLAGLGLVRHKQDRLEDAELLLARATKQPGGDKWQKNYRDIRYWSLLRQASANLAKLRVDEAGRQADHALQLRPRGVDALLTRAEVNIEKREYEQAETRLRQALAEQRDHLPAQQALVHVLIQLGQHEEAIGLAKGLPEKAQQELGGLARLRSEQALVTARQAQQRGDAAAQRDALELSLREDPNNLWARYDLARLYLRLGAKAEARGLMDGALLGGAPPSEALYASALFAVELGEWTKVRDLLARMPADSRDERVNRLVAEAEFQQRMAEIATLNRAGSYSEARVLLARLAEQVKDQPQRLAAVASAFADAKDPQRAATMLREQLSRSPGFDASLMLRYAHVMLQSERDEEVAGILRDLQQRDLSPGERTQYDDVLFLYRVRQADQLTERGDLAQAYEMLQPALAQRPQDPAAVTSLARMYAKFGDKGQALDLYRPMAQQHANNPLLLIGAADMASQQGHRDEAKQWLEQALKAAPRDPEIMTAAARIYRQQGLTKRASELMKQVVAQERREQQELYAVSRPGALPNNPFGQPAQPVAGAADAIPLPASAYVGQSTLPVSESQAPFGSAGVKPVNPFAQLDAQGRKDPRAHMTSAERLLDDLIQERSAKVTQGLAVRSNDSESGLSKLTDVQTPVEIDFPVGESRLALQLTPVHLSAGSVGSDAKQRFGAGALSAQSQLSGYYSSNPGATQMQAYQATDAALSESAGAQHASGVGIAVAWENESQGLKADLGVTPTGFLYSTAVGGVTLERAVEDHPHVRYTLSASRRAVTDSLTSFAGTRDARSGQKWGGVTASGVRAQIGYDDGETGGYGYGALHHLAGNNVKSNSRAELGAGVYWYLENEPDHLLTAGLSLTAIGYDNNQSSFNYGSGGYFSPQTFFSLAVPVQWAHRGERWSYKLRGSVGIQHFSQSATPYFINDKGMQQQLEQLSVQAASLGVNLPTRHDSASTTGLGYNLAGAAEYQLGQHWFLGGHLGVDNAQDYRQWNGGLYLRYMLENMTGDLALPVSPFQSPYAN